MFVYRDVASEVKLVLDAAGRLSPRLPGLQRQELGREQQQIFIIIISITFF